MKSLVFDDITISVSNPYPQDLRDHRALFDNVFSGPEYFDFFTSLSANDGYLISARSNSGELSGMMFLLPCMLKNKDDFALGYYMYSVCVANSFRKRGIFRRMCEYADEVSLSLGGKFILLIPADSELYKTYERIGYNIPVLGRAPVGSDYQTHTLMQAGELLQYEIEKSESGPVFIMPLSVQPFSRRCDGLFDNEPLFKKALIKTLSTDSALKKLLYELPLADNLPE